MTAARDSISEEDDCLDDLPEAPTHPIDHGPLCFRVWADKPFYLEDPAPWKCVAAFRFLTEALEYIAECQDLGLAVVFQSPTGASTITPADRRAVYKAEEPKEWPDERWTIAS